MTLALDGRPPRSTAVTESEGGKSCARGFCVRMGHSATGMERLRTLVLTHHDVSAQLRTLVLPHHHE